MTGGTERPYAEPMSMSSVEEYVYEAIATAERTGRPVARTEIAAVSDLDDQTLDATLEAMTSRGLLSARDGDAFQVVKAPLPPGIAGGAPGQ